jgi:hypothetical protein
LLRTCHLAPNVALAQLTSLPYDVPVRLLLILAVLAAALFAACGGDDDSNATTAPASATEEASGDATRTATPAPTPTIAVLDEDDEPNLLSPLIQVVAAKYLGQLPPVSLTDPPSCEGINAEYDDADADEQAALDEINTGRICILLEQSVFGDETASVVVGLYRSDTIETLEMELQDGVWVITN